MKRVCFNYDWNMVTGDQRMPFGPITGGAKVDLPHDFILDTHRAPGNVGGSSTAFFGSGQAVYIKQFATPGDWKGKNVLLDIDGAYMNAEVTLNNDLLAQHPYGYTPVLVDLTDKLRDSGENSLNIKTQSRQPNSRWYSGGGLYRLVSVWVGGAQYIHPWGLCVTTPEVSAQKSTVHAAAKVTNSKESAVRVNVVFTIVDADGKQAAAKTVEAELDPAAETAVSADLTVENAKLWDTESPNLYTMKVAVTTAAGEVDVHEETFGIRKIEIDPENGFRINGKSMKLRGGCLHHDNGVLGAAAYPAAEDRKVRLLKEAGYNALRCAHNPPSRTMLDACDRYGMLVIDESFDMWRMGKTALDYHQYFERWWKYDTYAMIMRDRNHPCVYCWSIGNEIPEMTGKSNGAYWAKVQADYVRELDPTRPPTLALNMFYDMPEGMRRQRDMKRMLAGEFMPDSEDGRDLWAEQTEGPLSCLDLIGYNYMFKRYEKDREKYPNRVIHATETHAFNTYDYWQAVMNNDHVIGDYIWTATDNLGEAGAGRVIWDLNEPINGLMGPWPWLSCYQGDLDLLYLRRPQSYFRKVMWGLDPGVRLFTTHPSRTGVPFYGMGWHWQDVKQNWTFDDEYLGKPVKVEAYADADEVEFLVNGKSFGRAAFEKLQASMEVPYEPGVLEAVAYKGGKEVARDSLRTAGKPSMIRLVPDRDEIANDGMDLSFVKIEITDAEGNIVFDPPYEVSVSVSGAGTLAGLGSANPKTDEDYGTCRRLTFDGVAGMYVRSACGAGRINVTVIANGLTTGSVSLTSK